MAPTEPTGSAASRMRAAIDRGETSDKLDHPDPAAAPLGTDDDAAGLTSDPAAVEASTQRQRGITSTASPKSNAKVNSAPRPSGPMRSSVQPPLRRPHS